MIPLKQRKCEQFVRNLGQNCLANFSEHEVICNRFFICNCSTNLSSTARLAKSPSWNHARATVLNSLCYNIATKGKRTIHAGSRCSAVLFAVQFHTSFSPFCKQIRHDREQQEDAYNSNR